MRRFVAVVTEHNGRFLVRRRAANVVNGSLWEFPNVEISASGRAGRPKRAAVQVSFGLELKSASRLCTIKHTITRYRITLEVFHGRATTAFKSGRWCTIRELDRLPFSSAHKQIVQKLSASGSQPVTPKAP